MSEENKKIIESVIPFDTLRAYRGVYLETAQRLKDKQGKSDVDASGAVDNLDFEFVLFASAVVDYDFIISLIARYTQNPIQKQNMTKEQLIGIIDSDAKFIDERDDIAAYINSLKVGAGLSEDDIKNGYEDFKAQKLASKLNELAEKHGIDTIIFKEFVNLIMTRMIFDGELLSDLLAPLELGWKARAKKELELMEELIPFLRKLAGEQEISGLSVYE